MKKLLVLLFIICLFAQTFAQVNGIIRGNVKDVNTQQALEAVEIILTSSTDSEVEYVVVTDENGNFSIQIPVRSEEHTSELQSRGHLVCRLLLEKKNNHK